MYTADIREYKYSAPRMLNGCYRHKIIATPSPIWAYSYNFACLALSVSCFRHRCAIIQTPLRGWRLLHELGQVAHLFDIWFAYFCACYISLRASDSGEERTLWFAYVFEVHLLKPMQILYPILDGFYNINQASKPTRKCVQQQISMRSATHIWNSKTSYSLACLKPMRLPAGSWWGLETHAHNNSEHSLKLNVL